MGKGTKQLTDAVAVTRAARMPRGAIRRRDPQCRTGIFKAGKFGVFPQARKHTAAGIGDDEFEPWKIGATM